MLAACGGGMTWTFGTVSGWPSFSKFAPGLSDRRTSGLE